MLDGFKSLIDWLYSELTQSPVIIVDAHSHLLYCQDDLEPDRLIDWPVDIP